MTSFLRILLACVCALLLAIPASAAAAPPLKMFWDSADMDGRDAMATLDDLGVDVLQLSLAWYNVAPTRPADPTNPDDPAYDWSAIDAKVQAARAVDMDVALMLIGVPGWANGDRGLRHAPDDPRDFADFATAAARRYPDVRLWMVWGEPDFVHKFQPQTPQKNFGTTRLNRAQQRAPRLYAKLVDAAYGALKAESRRNRVIGGMTAVSGDIRPFAWIRYMRLPNGKPPRMDLYGHNPFGAREPNLRNPPSPQGAADFSDLARLQRAVDRRLAKPRGKSTLRLFLSEYAIPTGPDSEFNFYTTPRVQAKWIRSAFRVARKLNAYGLGWIHLYDEGPGGSRAGLLTQDGTPKPGYAAFKRAR